jgi:antitoxin component of MazEF toxin-antitoxin module
MEVSVKKVGKSLGVEFSKDDIRELGLKEGMKLDIEIRKKAAAAPDDGWGD